MPKTTLQLINSTLALIGEQALLSSSGTLGELTRDALNTALVNVAQETRANVFESTIQVNATNNDYLVPALTLPSSVLQVFTVSLRQSTGSNFGDNLIQLEYLPLESLTSSPAYAIAGSNLYLSPTIARPATVFIRCLQSFTLPVSDAADSGLPDVVIPAVQHSAASILALSYLDDPNQAAIQQNLAQRLLDKLKTQYGNFRAKAFNISGTRGNIGFGAGGLSGVSGAIAYAPLDSPTFTGDPKAPTPSTSDNDTSIATTAYVKDNLASYLTTANASATYATIASLGSYLTTTSAASTYAPITSPAFLGNPTATTQAVADNSTRVATTAFVKAQGYITNAQLQGDTAWTNVTLVNSWVNFGSPFPNTSFLKTGDGVVFVRGFLAKGSVPTGDEIIFTLPAGYRPSGIMMLTQPSAHSNEAICRINVLTDGSVRWMSFIPNSSSPVVYLAMYFSFSTV